MKKKTQFRLHQWIQSCCSRSKALWGGLDCSPRANSPATSLHPILAASLCLSKRQVMSALGPGDPMRSSKKMHNWGLMQGLHHITYPSHVNLHSCARIFTERILIEVMMLHHCTMTRTKWSCPSGGKHSKCSQAHNQPYKHITTIA